MLNQTYNSLLDVTALNKEKMTIVIKSIGFQGYDVENYPRQWKV